MFYCRPNTNLEKSLSNKSLLRGFVSAECWQGAGFVVHYSVVQWHGARLRRRPRPDVQIVNARKPDKEPSDCKLRMRAAHRTKHHGESRPAQARNGKVPEREEYIFYSGI